MSAEDRQLIAELVQNWVVWGDAGDWERFATVRHDDGVMIATQTELGFAVKRDLSGLTGDAVTDVYRLGARWLAGDRLR